jgi:hypothetical protein
MAKPTQAALVQRLEDANVRQRLIDMETDPLLHPQSSSYSANAMLYPDGQMPFVEKHVAYLMDHPQLDPDRYLSNLRLMLKK